MHTFAQFHAVVVWHGFPIIIFLRYFAPQKPAKYEMVHIYQLILSYCVMKTEIKTLFKRPSNHKEKKLVIKVKVESTSHLLL